MIRAVPDQTIRRIKDLLVTNDDKAAVSEGNVVEGEIWQNRRVPGRPVQTVG
jgi:hypothetical protein